MRAGLLAWVLIALSACGGKDTTEQSTVTGQGAGGQSQAQQGAEAVGDLETPPASGSIEDRLGIDVATAKTDSIEALVGGSSNALVGRIWQAFKKLPKSERADAVRALALCLKAFFESNEFANGYTKLREERKPTPPVFEKTVDEELAGQIADNKRSLAESRAAMSSLPAESRPEMEKILAQTEAQLSDPTMIGYMRQGIESQRASAQASFEEALAQWQTSYPPEPKGLIVQRLNQFVALTADVDFDAQLVDKDDRRVFAKPEYEAKSYDWKTCYRAGKPAVAAARDVATQWLAELR